MKRISIFLLCLLASTCWADERDESLIRERNNRNTLRTLHGELEHACSTMDARCSHTELCLMTYNTYLALHYARHHAYPERLVLQEQDPLLVETYELMDLLDRSGMKKLVHPSILKGCDGWDRPFHYAASSNSYSLVSAGQNGVIDQHTPVDDIASDQPWFSWHVYYAGLKRETQQCIEDLPKDPKVTTAKQLEVAVQKHRVMCEKLGIDSKLETGVGVNTPTLPDSGTPFPQAGKNAAASPN